MKQNTPDLEKIIKTAIELFGNLRDPEVYPKQFHYQLRLAQFELSLKDLNSDS